MFSHVDGTEVAAIRGWPAHRLTVDNPPITPSVAISLTGVGEMPAQPMSALTIESATPPSRELAEASDPRGRGLALPDAELVARCRAGSEAAWFDIVGRYRALVTSVIRRYRLDEDEAADVAQEVWVAAWRGINALREPNRLGAWLATLAGRVAWDSTQRRSRGRLTEPLETALATAADEQPGPERLATNLEDAAELRAALRLTSQRCQLLIRTLYFSQREPTYAELARVLGCSSNSVGPLRTRSFQELRRALDSVVQTDTRGGTR
ncbi:MAG: sigma-70 family RNA polymerase sigma factor [Chloroflexota bacterium]